VNQNISASFSALFSIKALCIVTNHVGGHSCRIKIQHPCCFATLLAFTKPLKLLVDAAASPSFNKAVE
jgi:hypothetical protein